MPKNTVIELRKQGLTLKEVSDKTGVPRSTVRNWVRSVIVAPELIAAGLFRVRRKAAKARSRETATRKYCPRCEKYLPKKDFHKRGQYLMGYCKACQCDYVNDRRRAERLNLRVFIDSFKVGRPCVDCGQSFEPFAMDFDHRDPTQKRFNVSVAVNGDYSKSAILKEISKCDLVCAVCHRYRTYGSGRVPTVSGAG